MAKVSTLLVIGNGFDLAHGMKTSYRDILNAIISYMAVGSQNIDFTSEEELKAYARKFDVDMIKKCSRPIIISGKRIIPENMKRIKLLS